MLGDQWSKLFIAVSDAEIIFLSFIILYLNDFSLVCTPASLTDLPSVLSCNTSNNGILSLYLKEVDSASTVCEPVSVDTTSD